MSKLALFALTVVLMVASPRQSLARPSVFVVNSTLDKPDGIIDDGKCTTSDNLNECTLRAAIMTADYLTDTTILVPAGVYTLTLPPTYPWYIPSWFGHLEIVRPMSIIGAGAGKTIIDGNRDVIGEAVMLISGSAVISGVTIQNGAGGMIGNGSIQVINSAISNNVQRYTAGLTTFDQFVGPGVRGVGITLINSTVSDNLVEVFGNSYPGVNGNSCGGGVRGTVTLIDSLVARNVVSASNATGGGICGDSVTLVNTKVISNAILGCKYDRSISQGIVNICAGGGVWIRDGRISLSEISGNIGGGIAGDGGQVFIDGTNVFSNVRAGPGAGVLMGTDYGPIAMLRIQNSTIYSNTATGSTGSGGGIYATTGPPYYPCGKVCTPIKGLISVFNSTISGNSAQTSGGGMELLGDPIVLQNVTIVHNTAGTNGAISGTISVSDSLLAYNISADGGPPCAGCMLSSSLVITQPISGTRVVDPLADNGGPTLTHALPPGSPAINAGAAACIDKDQRGVRRPYGGRCDLGAFEVQLGEPPRQIFLPLVAR